MNKNVMELLKENDIVFNLKYYGISDLATSWDLNAIIKNKEIIYKFFKNKNYPNINQTNIDYFIDYLFIKKIKKMEEIIPHIKDDNIKREFSSFLGHFKTIEENFEKGKIIKFINEEYKDILKIEKNEVLDITLDLITTYQTGINDDVLEYISKKRPFKVLCNFENIQKVILKKENIMNELFCDINIDSFLKTSLDYFLDINKFLYNRSESTLIIKNILENNINKIKIFSKNIIENIDSYNINFAYFSIYKISIFFQSINDPYSNFLIPKLKLINEKMNNEMDKHGKISEFSINLNSEIEKTKNYILRENDLLIFTHSNYENIFNTYNNHNKSLVDLVTTNFKKDDYFTFSHQEELKIILNANSKILYYFLKDKSMFFRLMNLYFNTLNKINNIYNIKLNEDMVFLYNSIRNIFYCTNDNIKKQLNHSSSVFILSLIEKILRNVYKHEMLNEEYINIENKTLGNLLNKNNKIIENILGFHQVKALKFFLIKDEDNQIGSNYRNNLIHWHNISFKEINTFSTTKLFYMFTSIINSIYKYSN